MKTKALLAYDSYKIITIYFLEGRNSLCSSIMMLTHILKYHLHSLKRSVFFHCGQCIREESKTNLSFFTLHQLWQHSRTRKGRNHTTYQNFWMEELFQFCTSSNLLSSSPHLRPIQKKISTNSSLYPLGILALENGRKPKDLQAAICAHSVIFSTSILTISWMNLMTVYILWAKVPIKIY